MTATAMAAESATPFTPTRVAIGSALYDRVLEAYYDEAQMLDELRFVDWTKWLAEDLRYTAPQRLTRTLADHAKSIERSVMHFDESYRTIAARVRRLGGNSAWAEDPPSRTRRLVTNVRIATTEKDNEYAVRSYFLLTRSRFEQTQMSLLSGERHDVVRDLGDRFELAFRESILDQAVLGMPNLAVFI
ncbi:3-phenylpropionate/cinnamic acid dioxygenase subunit beta [Sphingobium naphthae]|uniref:3-phenylpropionate/cinnamic acid dioxygenase subunit beta n=1 Tax=Sphingobium naphthae TaxID=1886786 RepID=A0ABU4A150_9SPHN|nr:3-phenylpropionate/cinnamic acid dioxygenase subunit beta [Sphingobium naphthae]MCC4250821.1 3-phenylpropionate/cinnamic acid dioxygenase subunit beta [Sphingobium naphthae]MDV5825462.1 3-phenylpropionate/cinnamic acid dioxygenase subunit beta [Sphingobium naphthae]|tara:strand:- start:352 stop:915 length:564 start_codon:yes stop_codon:yes gene_type:complete